MTEYPESTPTDQGDGDPRRNKLNQIIELGVDPYGQRFDDRGWINDIRNQQTEIKFVTKDGNKKGDRL